jgi:quercetin dioxygenase-like cupin family protein
MPGGNKMNQTHRISPLMAPDLTHIPTTMGPGTAQSRRIYNPIQKDAVTFLQTAQESNGAVTLFEMEVAPGGGNLLHYHNLYDEHFTVLSGELGVRVGKEQFKLRAGQSAVAPAKAHHRWYNVSPQTAVVTVELRPGSSGFERFLQIIYGLAGDGLTNSQGFPKSIVHLAILVEMADTNVPGLFSVLAPLLRTLAAHARRQGIEHDLIERYGL